MRLKSKFLIIFSLAVLGLLLFGGKAEAAIISVFPNYEEFVKEETFSIEVRLNSEQKVVNAVQVMLKYPTDLLEAVSVSKGGSFLTLWAQEPSIEKSAGVISLAGGRPGGSLVVNGLIATVVFKAKLPGQAKISFDSSSTSVHLNDGLGTALPLKFKEGAYKIKNITYIKLSSSTHPSEDKWYQSRDFKVSWHLNKGSKYSYVLTANPSEEPDDHSEPVNGPVSFYGLRDGIYYFKLKEQAPTKPWQLVGKRRVMVDGTKPSSLDSVISREKSIYNGRKILVFSAVDKVSGIDHYDVIEGGKLYPNVKSPYLLKDQEQKDNIKIIAYDKAGNSREYTYRGQRSGEYRHSVADWSIFALMAVAAIIIAFFIFWKIRGKKAL